MGWQIHRWRPSHVDISHLMKLDTGKRFRHGVTDVEFGLDGSGLNLFCCCPIENRKIPNVNVASLFGWWEPGWAAIMKVVPVLSIFKCVGLVGV